MLRITIELVPHGDESKKKHLGTAIIVNDGTGGRDVGNYYAKFSHFDSPNKTWKCSTCEGFKRLKRGPWDLLYIMLKDAVGSRNKEK